MVRTPDDALEAHSDVLILPDCCAAVSSVAEPCSGVTELIAACRFGTEAPGVGQLSFTRSLIEELDFWLIVVLSWRDRYKPMCLQGSNTGSQDLGLVETMSAGNLQFILF